MLKNNYHTHMKYCGHADGDVADYVKSAIKLGIKELGMTDHAPEPDGAMTEEEILDNKSYRYMKKDMVRLYLNQIREQQMLNLDKITILSGFETEYIEGYIDHYKWLRSKVDYLNLGIHFFKDLDGHLKNSYKCIDYKNVMEYAKNVVKGIETGLFNVVVHPDLYMFRYKDEHGNRTFDENAKKAAKMILEAAIKNNVYVEVNCNAISWADMNDESSWPYPNKDFWMFAKEYKDLKIIVGADAHKPERLGTENIAKAYEFINEIGLKIEDKMEIVK